MDEDTGWFGLPRWPGLLGLLVDKHLEQDNSWVGALVLLHDTHWDLTIALVGLDSNWVVVLALVLRVDKELGNSWVELQTLEPQVELGSRGAEVLMLAPRVELGSRRAEVPMLAPRVAQGSRWAEVLELMSQAEPGSNWVEVPLVARVERDSRWVVAQVLQEDRHLQNSSMEPHLREDT